MRNHMRILRNISSKLQTLGEIDRKLSRYSHNFSQHSHFF